MIAIPTTHLITIPAIMLALFVAEVGVPPSVVIVEESNGRPSMSVTPTKFVESAADASPEAVVVELA